MRIALVGKGGSGKTTLTTLLALWMKENGKTGLAIDADINQHLARALGIDEAEYPPQLGHHMDVLKKILCGSRQDIKTPAHVMKTTPPAKGSHFITLSHDDPVIQNLASPLAPQFWMMAVGDFENTDLGHKCYHAKTGAVELILNHLDDRNDEWVLLDMTAGADAFASGLFTRFDLTILVVEPTEKSVAVYQQYKNYAKEFNITLRVIGNKIEDDDDLAFLKHHCGEDFLDALPFSSWVKRHDRGEKQSFALLEKSCRDVLQHIFATAAAHPRDAARYWHWAKYFHKLNSENWGNQSLGVDARQQIDDEFLESLIPTSQPNERKTA